jgi:hypothetical protein
MTRATLDALRDAPGPMTLRHQKKRGILRSVKDPQHGRFDLWEIAV